MDCYMDKIAEIGKKLQNETIGEVEAKLGVNIYNYTGVGFGYNLKDNYPKTREEAFQSTQTPEYDELVRIAKAL